MSAWRGRWNWLSKGKAKSPQIHLSAVSWRVMAK
jgi:hypothetical protein